MLLVFVAVVVVAGLMVGVSFVAARRLADRAAALDAKLRPIESRSGRCEACEGAGTRIESRPTVANASNVARSTCFRCGGTGLPPVVGEAAVAPGATPLGLMVREIAGYLRVRRDR